MPTRTITSNDKKLKPSRKPILIDYVDLYNSLDAEFKKIEKMSAEDNPRNREFAYWNESIAQSLGRISVMQIIGDGLKIRCDKNKKAEEIIDNWNRSINVRREPIEKFIHDSWIDNLIHAKSYYRILRNPDLEYKIDIQRLDPKTIEIQEDPKYGYRAFIQKVGDYKAHRSEYAFYRNVVTDLEKGVVRDPMGRVMYSSADPVAQKTKNVVIQDKPYTIIFTSFFKKAPVATVMKYIAYKQVIALLMRKYAQKHLAPFILAFIGDKDHYPENPKEMQEAIDYASQQLQKIVSFGGGAFPGNVDVKPLETNTARSSEIFVLYMDAMNKEIMWGLHSSMSLRQAAGRELATSQTIKEGEYQFMKGIRRLYELKLTNFYANCLLPANGIKDLRPIDIDIEYSPLRVHQPQELAQAITMLRQAGVFKDKNELRKATAPLFGFLKDLDNSLNKILTKDMLDKDESPSIA